MRFATICAGVFLVIWSQAYCEIPDNYEQGWYFLYWEEGAEEVELISGPYKSRTECEMTAGFFDRKEGIHAVSSQYYYHSGPRPPKVVERNNEVAVHSAGDGKIQVVKQGNGTFEFLIQIKEADVGRFNTKSIAGDAGRIDNDELGIHFQNNDSECFVVVRGIGIHNDIFYVSHFSHRDGKWRFDNDFGVALGQFGCGEKGMKSGFDYHDDHIILRFWVGSGSPCKIKIWFENGKAKYEKI